MTQAASRIVEPATRTRQRPTPWPRAVLIAPPETAAEARAKLGASPVGGGLLGCVLVGPDGAGADGPWPQFPPSLAPNISLA